MQEKSIGRKDAVSDKEWIDKIKANDRDILKKLYVTNFPKAKMFILNNNGTETDAKDIFQEAFIAFWRNVQLNKFTVMNPHTVNQYLLKITKNKWIDFLRKQKKIKVLTTDTTDLIEETLPHLSEDDEKHLNKIKNHFSKMGEPCKELLYRFYFKQERLEQLARRFSWKETTAKNNKYRCLQKLRKAVLSNL